MASDPACCGAGRCLDRPLQEPSYEHRTGGTVKVQGQDRPGEETARMITPDFCRMMARYNRWQNRAILGAAEGLPAAERVRDRGAHWGSIAGTLSHLLWGDMVWMARLDGGRRPDLGLADSATLSEDWDELRRDRQSLDARIHDWAARLSPEDLQGELFWHSRDQGRAVSRPMGLCVAHFFNHQAHHRGQVHAMLTAAGARPGVTDLLALPDDADWM